MTQPFDSQSERAPSKTVILVYPNTGIDVAGVSVFLPLSVIFLASALREEGFWPRVIDMRVDTKWQERLRRAAEEGPLYVGISAMTGKQIHWGLKAAALVRGVNPDIPIVWGGTHASVLPDETLQDEHVDAVVVGKGETLASVIARKITNKDTEVSGRVFRETPLESGIQPDLAIPLDYEHIELDTYLTPIVQEVRGLAHVTSRGCPHKCGYCYNRAVHSARWTASPPGAVIEQLERISRTGVSGVLFFDDNFFVSRQRVEEIAKGIIDKKLNVTIKADCRADYLTRYSDAFLALIKKAGFELLYIGAESGSDRMLEVMHKGVDVGGLLRANERLRAVGIRPHYSFMAGLPGERIADMRATVRLMERLKQDHPGAYLSPVKAYVPYPGTDLFEAARGRGFSPPSTLEGWSAYDWNNRPSPWLTRAEARFVEKMIYVSAGLDPSIMELSGIDRSRFATWGFMKFAMLCRRRARKPDLGLIPELPIVRLVKRLVSA
jgi:radical SAM superfamily enzyme YgiQ (UPF0313 family)